jgi:hypothetical protein
MDAGLGQPDTAEVTLQLGAALLSGCGVDDEAARSERRWRRSLDPDETANPQFCAYTQFAVLDPKFPDVFATTLFYLNPVTTTLEWKTILNPTAANRLAKVY